MKAPSHPDRARALGLSLVEIVVALALLVVLLLGFASMSTVSLTATRSAKPSLLAQEACERVVEEMQSLKLSSAKSLFWDTATHQSIGGVDYAVSGAGLNDILYGSDGVVGLLQYIKGSGVGGTDAKGQMGAPLDGYSPLRVRFLNESEYLTIWSLPSNTEADLNFNGSLDAGPVDATYTMYPVLVEVRWSEGSVDRRYQLKAVLTKKEAVE